MLSKETARRRCRVAFTVTAANAQVVVSSKIYTEGGLLGNIISQVLQAKWRSPVTEKIQLGGTPVVRRRSPPARIDIYPEYTGNAAIFFEKADVPLWTTLPRRSPRPRSSI